MQFEVNVPWIESLEANFHLGVDGLSVPLIFLTALLMTLSVYYSAGTIHTRVKEYFVTFHMLALSMFGVFMALDYVLFYLFWEISLVPMYLLIGIWGGKNRNYASIKFFIYTLVGSVAMLLAILGTYFATGTFDIIEAAVAQPFMDLPADQALLLSSLAFWGFFLGFAFKVPSFPFHTWLPDAHTEAPTAGSVILGRRAAEAGRLRLPAHHPADLPHGQQLLVDVDCGSGRHCHCLRRVCLCRPDRSEATDCLQFGQPHGLCHAGHRRGGLHASAIPRAARAMLADPRMCEQRSHGHQRRDAADVQPRHHHRRALPFGRRDL